MIFNFKDLVFEGLRFRRFRKYPWNSKKEGKAYFDKLIEDGTHLSQIKYQDLMKEQFDEMIHIKLSWSMIFKILSSSMIILAIIFWLPGFYISSIIILSVGVIFEIFSKLMERHAYEEYMAKDSSAELVNLLFNH